MQTFSTTLSELYDAAESCDPDSFPAEAFRLLRQLLFFDGGLLGSALAPSHIQGRMLITRAFSHGRAAALLNDYISVVADDPVARQLVNGITVPHSSSCKEMYKERRLLPLFAYARKHDISEVLTFGDPPAASGLFRWTMLYRRAHHPFDSDDAMLLKAWWPHLVRASVLNLRFMLDRRRDKRDRVLGVLDTMGNIEVGHELFTKMLREEWPREQGRRLPRPVWNTLEKKGLFRGSTLCLTTSRQCGYLICEAQSLSEIDRLGALERSVAELLADGNDYKTIATRMGTSPNTVRNQISRIYKKLNVHDKLSLAMLFHRGDPADSPASTPLFTSSRKLRRSGARIENLPVYVSESTLL